MTNETHDRMHELLCAYVLGEATEAECHEVETALAASEDLRGAKARIESTIGLVQTVLVKDEALSDGKRDEVLRAVTAPPPRPFWRQTWVRAAAAVLVVSFGFAGWSVYHRNVSTGAIELALHDVDRAEPRSEARGLDARRKEASVADRAAAAKPKEPAPESALGVEEPLAASKAARSGGLDGAFAKTETSTATGLGKKADDASAAPGLVNGRTDAPTDAKDLAVWTRERSESDRRITDSLYAIEPSAVMPGQANPTAPPLLPMNQGVDNNAIFYAGRDVGAETGAAPSEQDLYLGGGVSQPPPVGTAMPELAKKHEAGLAGGGGPSTPAPNGPTSGSASGFAKGAPGAAMPPAASAPGEKVEAKLQQSSDHREQWVRTFEELESLNVLQDEKAVNQDLARWAEVSKRRAYRFGQSELSDEDQFVLRELGFDPNAPLAPSGGVQPEPPTITPELRAKYRDAYVHDWCRRIVVDCGRRPHERPRDMYFRFWGDNPFELAALDPLSTFSADVDTASYALARRYVSEGHLPEKAQVRTEEFVNAFKADVPAPEKGTFAIHTTLAPSRYGAASPGEATTSARDMLRVVIRGKDVPKAERKPLALTFVVDCSGSMKEQSRIEMVKHAMRQLVNQLDARDSIAIVKFSTDAAQVLPMTSAKQKDVIEAAIYPLAAEGSTNSEAGLRLGYATALAGLNVEATNRVVFLSDGVANVGVTDPNVISEGVRSIREKGVYLNTIGVGMNNHNDVLLEQLADKGDGVCNYVDGPDEVKRVFVDQFTGAMETIARDVKLQVEFDPAQVARYRLLGYENRAIADADFRNDTVDAGEVGAGHQVTALYEIEYASPSPSSEKPLATVRVRFKAPRNLASPTANEEATEIARPVTVAQRTSWEGAGPSYRRSAIVAQYAEFLRRSTHARSDSFEQMLADAKKLEVESKDAATSELVTLMEKAKALILNGWPNRDELALAIDQIRQNHVLRAELEQLARERDRELLAELELQNRKLEERLRELLRHRLEQPR